MEIPPGKKVVLFDGVCNLCNTWVQRILKREQGDIFLFASLQSPEAETLTKERGINTEKVDSIILIDPGVAYYLKSDAALEIARHLKGYRWLPPLISWIPRSIRDLVYDFIARNRYKWYGKRESCMLPSPETANKFLDAS